MRNTQLSHTGKQPLRADFNCIDVLDNTQETAMNWFNKISTVRELIARLYGYVIDKQDITNDFLFS